MANDNSNECRTALRQLSKTTPSMILLESENVRRLRELSRENPGVPLAKLAAEHTTEFKVL